MISIVVPIFNGEKYIEDCLKSILMQTYVDWELIMVDNASTDDSLRICKEYAAKDDRIQVLQQHHNVGVSMARNLGIEKTRGEFITFIDIDDWVEKDYLEKLSSIQRKKNADMVICEYHKAFEEDRALLKEKAVNKKSAAGEKPESRKCQLKVYETEEYLDKYFLEGNTHCWGVLFEKELLDRIYFPKRMTIGEDMLFLLEISEKAKKIVVTNYKGYHYYINEAGAMNKKFTLSYMDQITCWENALKKIKERYPKLAVKAESIVVVSVLLVVGKLSKLGNGERKEYAEAEKECYRIFLKYAQKKEIKKFLPSGYPLKCFVYRYFPKVYMGIYGKLR